MNMNTTQKGIFFAFLAAIISGISIFYAKYAVLKIDSLILITSRNFLVGLIFLFLVIKNRNKAQISHVSKKQMIGLLFISICGAVPFYLFFTGLSIITPLTANAIHKTLFIWVGLLSIIFFKEKINKWISLGYFLFIGVQIITSQIQITYGTGELFVFAATLIWAVEHLVTKRLHPSFSAELMGLVRMGGGSMILFATSIITGRVHEFSTISSSSLIVPVIVGSCILFAYVFFWYKALSMERVSVVSFILTFSVVVGGILNTLINRSILLPAEILLMVSVIFSVILVSITEFRNIHDPAHVR